MRYIFAEVGNAKFWSAPFLEIWAIDCKNSPENRKHRTLNQWLLTAICSSLCEAAKIADAIFIIFKKKSVWNRDSKYFFIAFQSVNNICCRLKNRFFRKIMKIAATPPSSEQITIRNHCTKLILKCYIFSPLLDISQKTIKHLHLQF